MTAIVYHDGKLIGDRKNVALTLPTAFVDAPKVFISKDRQFAYGVAGTTINDSIRPEMEQQLRVLLEHAVLAKEDVIEVSKLFKETYIDGFSHGTIMTRELQFGIFGLGGRARRLDGHTHGIGTGGNLLAACLICGVDLKQAMVVVNRIDMLTGTKIDVIHANKLKPFVIRGTSK